MVLEKSNMEPAPVQVKTGESGFSLMEVAIAALLLIVGLVGMAYAFTVGAAVVSTAQEDTIARQKLRQALESILTGRNTANISFNQIDNVGTGSGIFLVGYQPLYGYGADGIIGTADDAASGIETIVEPGPDGVLGTADDIVLPLTNYQRQIIITDLTGTLKGMQVKIQYVTPSGLKRTVQVQSYVSPYIQ
jgi:hypothetical protein